MAFICLLTSLDQGALAPTMAMAAKMPLFVELSTIYHNSPKMSKAGKVPLNLIQQVTTFKFRTREENKFVLACLHPK